MRTSPIQAAKALSLARSFEKAAALIKDNVDIATDDRLRRTLEIVNVHAELLFTLPSNEGMSH